MKQNAKILISHFGNKDNFDFDSVTDAECFSEFYRSDINRLAEALAIPEQISIWWSWMFFVYS